MNIEALKELIGDLEEKVKVAFSSSSLVELEQSEVMSRTHIDYNGASYEKYFGKDKEVFSITYRDGENVDQIVVLKSGTVVVYINGEYNPFDLNDIKDEDVDYLIGYFYVMLNRINSKSNKHK